MSDGKSTYGVDEACVEIEKYVAECIAEVKVEQNRNKEKVEALGKTLKEKETQNDKKTNDLIKRVDALENSQKSIAEAVKSLEERIPNIIIQCLTAGLKRESLNESITSQSSSMAKAVASTPKSASTSSIIGCRRFYHDDSDISRETIELLKPFVTPSTSNDKLNQYQRAFLKYFLSCRQEEAISEVMVNQCIVDGQKMKLWSKDFVPSDTLDLPTYIKEALRNQRKNDRRSEQRQSQKRRLSDYVIKAMESMTEDKEMSE